MLNLDQVNWIVFLVFVGACFMFGGGSRADITSLIILRPLSFIVVGYALATAPLNAEKVARMPLILLLSACALLALQLVPLPQSLWVMLPGRDLIAKIDSDAGLGAIWRPMTLSPSRTANSLFAMGVPLGAVLMLGRFDVRRRDAVVWLLLLAGTISAVLGLLQVIGPNRNSLYLYRIANFGAPVGFFANRNHQAVFLASLIPLFAYSLLKLRLDSSAPRRPMLLSVLLGEGFVCLALILATGSRAGTVLALVMALASGALWYLVDRPAAGQKPSPLRRLLLLLGACGVLALGVAMFANSRTPGIDRLFTQSIVEEMRARVFPVLWKLAGAYFPAGSGFGSFYLVYEIAEPKDLLQTAYLNQAHNDFLQVIIEGGLPALLLLVFGLGWFLWSGLRCWMAFGTGTMGRRRKVPLGFFAWLSLATLIAGSLVDYPMRTPALACVAAILAALVSSARASAPASNGSQPGKGL